MPARDRGSRTLLPMLGAMTAVAGLMWAAPADAQQIALRFEPRAGRTLRTLVWTEVGHTIADVRRAGEPATDTLRIDTEMMHSVTERVTEGRAGRWVVERTLDSTRGRSRAMGGAWRDAGADSVRRSARLVITDRLQIVEFSMVPPDTAPTEARDWLRNPAGAFELVFPEQAVAVGSEWTTELVLPVVSGADLAEVGAAMVAGTELVARVTVTLDSIVPRTTDTLAYLRVEGPFVPTTASHAPEVGSGVAAISGAFAANLIWSTGWDAWVSGVTRARLTVRVDAAAQEEGVQGGFEMRMDIGSRFQVRP